VSSFRMVMLPTGWWVRDTLGDTKGYMGSWYRAVAIDVKNDAGISYVVGVKEGSLFWSRSAREVSELAFSPDGVPL